MGMSRSHDSVLLSVVGLLHLMSLTESQILPYHCSISGCHNNQECDPFSTGCQCAGVTNENFYCAVGVVPGGGATCSGCADANTIGGGDICDPDDTTVCFCEEGYTGNTCEDTRISATCTGTGIDVIIKFYTNSDGSDFSGDVYVFDSTTFGDFSSVATGCSSSPMAGTYTTSVALDGSGSCQVTPALHADGDAYIIYVYVQYNDEFRSSSDDVIEITCDQWATVGMSAAVTVNNGNTVSAGGAITTTFYMDASGMTMILKNDAGGGSYTSIAGPLSVGDAISLIMQHDAPFTVGSCTAMDADDSNSATFMVDIIEQWCVTQDALSLMSGAVVVAVDAGLVAAGGTGMAGYLLRLDMLAWYFLGSSSNNLYLECDVCFDCEMPSPESLTCTNALTSYADQFVAMGGTLRRRRRDVARQHHHAAAADAGGDAKTGSSSSSRLRRQTEGGERVTTPVDVKLAVSVEVLEGNTKNAKAVLKNKQTGDGATSLSDCFTSVAVLLPIVLLVCLLITSLVMAVFFCRKVTQTPSPLHTPALTPLPYDVTSSVGYRK